MSHIVEMGDPILRTNCRPISDPTSDAARRLVQVMVQTLKEQKGIGIAAPQIGVDSQVFIVAPDQVIQPPYTTLNTGLVVFNPTITILSDDVTYEWEGCLSIPGIRGYVPRQCHIMIDYTNIKGESVSEEYDGFTARIFLHEFDHLSGTLFIDRIEDPKQDLITDRYYASLMEDNA